MSATGDDMRSIKRHLIFFRSILRSEPPAETLKQLIKSGLVRELDSDIAIQAVVHGVDEDR